MRARRAGAGMVLGLAACAAACAAAADWTLGPDGFGPLRIGMEFAQAQRIAGPALRRADPAHLPTRGCEQLPLPGHPGVALMFVDGVLHRIDMVAPGPRTEDGIGVGSTVEEVARAYPVLARTPHAYDDRESYLTVGPGHGRALRFETLKGKVAQAYGGDWAQVQYIEGCL